MRRRIFIAFGALLALASCGLLQPSDARMMGMRGGKPLPSGTPALTANINGTNVPMMAVARSTHGDGSCRWADVTVDLTGFSLAAGATMSNTLNLVNSNGVTIHSRTIENVDAVNAMPAGTFYSFGQPFGVADAVVGTFSTTTGRSASDLTALNLKVLLTNLATSSTSAADMDGAGTWTADFADMTWEVYGQGPHLRLRGSAPFKNGATTHRFLKAWATPNIYQKADGSLGPIEVQGIWIENGLLYGTNPGQFNYDWSWQSGATVIRSGTIRHAFQQIQYLMGNEGLGDWFGTTSGVAPRLHFKEPVAALKATQKVPPWRAGLTMPANDFLTVSSVDTVTDTITLATSMGSNDTAAFIGMEFFSTNTLPGGIISGTPYCAVSKDGTSLTQIRLYDSVKNARGMGILSLGTIVSGGTGYTVNDVLNFDTGIGLQGVAATARVDVVDGSGVIQPGGLTLLTPGTYQGTSWGSPNNTGFTSSPTGGTGTGASVTATYTVGQSPIGRIDLTSAGSGTITVQYASMPGAAGVNTLHLDGTGPRRDIGITTSWAANALYTGEKSFWRKMRIAALGTGCFRITSRSTSNKLVALLAQAQAGNLWDGTDRKNSWWGSRNSHTTDIEAWTGAYSSEGDNIDGSHFPNSVYTCWLVEGGAHLQTLGQHMANRSIGHRDSNSTVSRRPLVGSTQHVSICCNDSQPRETAWDTRDILCAAFMCTDGTDEQIYLKNLLDAQLNYVVDLLSVARTSDHIYNGVPQTWLDLGLWFFHPDADQTFSLYYIIQMMCLLKALHGDDPMFSAKIDTWLAHFLTNFVSTKLFNGTPSWDWMASCYRLIFHLATSSAVPTWAGTMAEAACTGGSSQTASFGASDVVTLSGQPFSGVGYNLQDGDQIMFLPKNVAAGSAANAPPAEITQYLLYYLKNTSGNTFQLSLTNGGAVVSYTPGISGVGTGFLIRSPPAAPGASSNDMSTSGTPALEQATAWIQALGISGGTAAYNAAAARFTGNFNNDPKFGFAPTYT